VEIAADPVACETYAGVDAILAGSALNGSGNIKDGATGRTHEGGFREGDFGGKKEIFYFFFDWGDEDGGGSISVKTFIEHTKIEFDYVAGINGIFGG